MTHRKNEATTAARIRIGISSCLLGAKVRYDGNHKLDTYITQTLGRFFDYVPVCPELAIGMGVPRPPIRLVGDPSAPRAVGVDDPALDVTARLAAYGTGMGHDLQEISGYILKSKSPSCGMERVKIYGAHGGHAKQGRGIYAAAFTAAQPLLPIEEDGRLGDPVLRENFIERVFAYHRWQELIRIGVNPRRLVEFHTRHKFALMAHSTEAYGDLGRLVARAGKGRVSLLAEQYVRLFLDTLKLRATRSRHANVMMHIMGFLKRELDGGDKDELLEVIHAYRRGQLPLVVPITLLKHHFRRHPDPYVLQQTYLNPHPQELMLRNSI